MPRRILLIQGDADAAKAVGAVLCGAGNGLYAFESAGSCAEGLAILGRDGQAPVAGVLLDLRLPDSSGIETFDRVFGAAPQTPILVLCATADEALARLAVQRGAQDYLLKERIDDYLLPKAVDSMIERAVNAEALFVEQERARVTLDSIGDAVLSIDVQGRITYLNAVAETLTGWPLAQAQGLALDQVFRLVDATTRQPVDNPMLLAQSENRMVRLTPNCLLIRRDGAEASIEDSATPIHDRRGQVTGAVMVFRDVTAARALTQRLAWLAQHDSLTDLPNRSLLNDRLGQAIARAERQHQPLAVLYLDIDRFKHVNDSLGHGVGDRLLQAVAQRLSACVRASDTVSRQGGDEFVVLLSEIAHERDAVVTAEKILFSLSQPYRIDDHELHLTASIGIVTYPDDGADATTLMRHADFAMYHAKNSGRGNCQFFKPEMNLSAIERQTVESGLRRAIDQQELVLHYQPKMDLVGGAIVGVEALMRWQHPQRGLLLPAEFIAIAEECGVIVPMGRWVLREACRQARAWLDAGLPPLRIAINTSAVELRDQDFVERVSAALADSGIAPAQLELELTETFLLQDAQSTATILRAVKALGVGLALDDFGTGYSSLSHLKRFPIDTLKIDQSFVRDIATDADDARIVSAVISMGRSLNLRVVAEGVETPEQLAYLRAQGCTEGQGYFFGRAVAADELTRLLA
jgi:diguanylate cyclase (GGDEF)-like protein/PAS domain S-box-containing protein